MVISWYRRVLRGSCFQRHNIPGAANQAAASRHIGDVRELVFGNVQKPASSSRSVADWLSRIRNSLFASIRRAVSERSSSSTFCVSRSQVRCICECVSTACRRNWRCTRSGTKIPIGQTLSSLFAPVHTVQAAFTAHGVPWDKFFIVNAVTFKVRIIYFFIT